MMNSLSKNSLFRLKFFLPLLIILNLNLFGQDTFEDRKAWLLDQVRDANVNFGEAKVAMPVACAHLYESNGTDAEALERVATSMDFNDRFFRMLGQVRAYYLSRDNFSPSQLDNLKKILTDDPSWYNTGTENHRLMVWTSGYLFAQAFPDEKWNWIENNVASELTSAELMEKLLALIITRGQWRYSGGYSEFLSPNYEIFHMAPMANLYDFAEDPAVRDIADAYLTYHLSNMALGSDEGYILAPYSRNATQGQRASLSIAQWIPWLYWGQNNPSELGAGDRYIIYLALSGWRPPEVLDAIGTKNSAFPFTYRSQQSHFQRSPLRYVMRTTYRAEQYSISSGVIRHVPSAFELDDSHFSITWKTSDEKRFIEAFHPYWRSKSSGEDSWRGPTSPFQQSIQHENTAILVYDIPELDPWFNIGQWAGERNRENIQMAQVRIPKAMTQDIASDDWYFFREGTTYVGIRPLQPNSIYKSVNPIGEDFAWDVIQSEGQRTGFIFEVGDENEFGSFENFQLTLKANSLDIDWEEFVVAYTNSRGDELKIRYNTSIEAPDGSIPESWINGQPIDYVNWPFIESPMVNLTGRILTLNNTNSWKRIDWSGELPVVSEGTGTVPPRLLIQFAVDGMVGEYLEFNLNSLDDPQSFSATDLPDGLSINDDTGTISGTPKTRGNFTATITATNTAGSSSEKLAFSINGPSILDLFPSAFDNGDGWFELPSIGWVYAASFPLVLHVQHGYWYAAGNSNNVYFFDYTMNSWLYTSETLYPYLYRFIGADSSYILFLNDIWSDEGTGRWFFDLNPAVYDYFFVPDPS